MFKPIHKHLIVSMWCKEPPRTTQETDDFLNDLVDAVGMTVVAGPTSVDVSEPGNEGPTGTVTLATSHASIHSWVENGRVEWDIYSCKEFNPVDALAVADRFQPFVVRHKLINRDELGL